MRSQWKRNTTNRFRRNRVFRCVPRENPFLRCNTRSEGGFGIPNDGTQYCAYFPVAIPFNFGSSIECDPFCLCVLLLLLLLFLPKSLKKALPKDVDVEQGHGQGEPPDQVKDDAFVRIQHVQPRPQIEPVHPQAQHGAVAAQHVRVRVGKRTLAPALTSCCCWLRRCSGERFVGRRSRGCHFELSSSISALLLNQ